MTCSDSGKCCVELISELFLEIKIETVKFLTGSYSSHSQGQNEHLDDKENITLGACNFQQMYTLTYMYTLDRNSGNNTNNLQHIPAKPYVRSWFSVRSERRWHPLICVLYVSNPEDDSDKLYLLEHCTIEWLYFFIVLYFSLHWYSIWKMNISILTPLYFEDISLE